MSSSGSWRSGASHPRIQILPEGIQITEYTKRIPALAGMRFLFFSDTHIKSRATHSFPPHLTWSAVKWIHTGIKSAIRHYAPDILLFGGDLASHTVWLDDAFNFLADLPETCGKFAVCGNWERRFVWLKEDFWRKSFQAAGFDFLCNEGRNWQGLYIYGLDDFKKGKPVFPASLPDHAVTCFLSHNPEAVLSVPDHILKRSPFFLSGHTHGGQIRFPLFGAIYTSTSRLKLFEYGAYRHPSGSELYVSSGIGTTWKNLRFLCPPEVLCLTFTP